MDVLNEPKPESTCCPGEHAPLAPLGCLQDGAVCGLAVLGLFR